ncbi:23S rRNA (pseudouridine(1915)-N(3))-methyltransferase RlmH [Rhodospirillaceae bacterium SYSU D60014]|uniref:23S rRNA (pseudouridine(1915)-N(3))-methyltransferase RlmH n=1 Tax=Virgifigura deserti TaxID=2268457 RepID=UPI000E674B8E
MRILVAAVGRARAGPARDLVEAYRRRIAWPLEIKEVEERRRLSAEEMKAREGELLLGALPKREARVVALDERGKMLSSTEFADLLGRWRDQGVAEIAFLIGGADGLESTVTARADLVLSLGRMTWPHLLVRGLLAEQLYRAQQILANHPYHRE